MKQVLEGMDANAGGHELEYAGWDQAAKKQEGTAGTGLAAGNFLAESWQWCMICMDSPRELPVFLGGNASITECDQRKLVEQSQLFGSDSWTHLWVRFGLPENLRVYAA